MLQSRHEEDRPRLVGVHLLDPLVATCPLSLMVGEEAALLVVGVLFVGVDGNGSGLL